MVSLADNLRQSAPTLQALLAAVQQAPTLTQMVMAAWRLGLAVALLVTQEVLTARAQTPTVWPVCPQCGTRLRSKGFVARQLTTLLGVVHWQRRVGRCPHGCAIAQVAPLDTALGLSPYQATSGEVQQLACALAVFVPFETAAALWRRCVLALPVSPAAIWGWVQSAGQRAMTRLECELAQLAAGQEPEVEPLAAPTATLPLLIGADGVLVPFRPQAGTAKGPTIWRAIKVAILARLRRRTTPAGQETTPLERRRLVAVLGDIAALTPRLWLEALRQGVRTAPLVAWISDGGRGFWRLFAVRFEGLATGILDFYHVAQHLWAGAAAWLGEHTPAARTWFESARHRLRHGESHAVLAELTETLTLPGLPASARDTLQKLYAYLDQHRTHIDYEKFKSLP